jgi:sugar lactone lactonase YvrE
MNEKTIATGLEFPEGPACDRNGNLYVVEIRGGRAVSGLPFQYDFS